MIFESLLKLSKNKKSLKDLLGGLLSDTESESQLAAEKLAKDAKSYGVSLQDYLRLAIDMNASDEDTKAFREAGMDGFEASLAYLSLPVKNDMSKGILLAQAGETFRSYPGTRLLFQPVMDEVLRFTTRQDQIERVDAIVGSSRTISSNEMISIVAESDEDAERTFTVAEGAKIPVTKITSSERSVRFYKHGGGYEFTYEFDRRSSIDILTPFIARINRRLELSKVRAATLMLINGDGINKPAEVVYQEDLMKEENSSATNTPNSINYNAFLKWLLNRAKAGTPVDTILGNYDTYLMWMLLFTPTLQSVSQAQAMAAAGGPSLNTAGIPGLFVPVNFAVSSAMPEKQMLGFIKNETLQELVEQGSQIQESEQAIRSQVITYVKSEVTGYKLIFGDTRSIYTTANKA